MHIVVTALRPAERKDIRRTKPTRNGAMREDFIVAVANFLNSERGNHRDLTNLNQTFFTK